ncbi:ATP-binding protein [Streptomyces sp. Z26]|uniref:ATP-binding protein n=2 Tax=Streptomyces TaxID=1883 RepID=UPI001404C970|nr:ATP-binding protein [Streptomyces sp. Z26]
MRFTSTPRGARLARQLVSHRLDEWGHPYGSDANETLTLITAELCANAVRHGHVPGRDFHVRLSAVTDAPTGAESVTTRTTLRVEVTDSRRDGVLPDPCRAPRPPSSDAESGRGLLLVARLADRWGIAPRPGAPGKDAWAELCAGPGGGRQADDGG